MTLKKIRFLKKKIDLKYKNILFNYNEYKIRYKYQLYLEIKKNRNYNQKKIISKSFDHFYDQIVGNKKNLLKFYKKYNVHLKLKKKYDRNLKAISKKNACIQTYLFLLNEIYFSNLFNDLQKLNSILKINDLIMSEFSEEYIKFKLIIKNNFEIERNIIRKVLS
tara:strand:+ start:1209 stop:1700 length:492 start_codon:yes stop_codon:yes gene_type:complete